MNSFLAVLGHWASCLSRVALLLRLRKVETALLSSIAMAAFTSSLGLPTHLELIVGIVDVGHLLRDDNVGHARVVLTRHPHGRVACTLGKVKTGIASRIVEHRFRLYVILLHCNHLFVFILFYF